MQSTPQSKAPSQKQRSEEKWIRGAPFRDKQTEEEANGIVAFLEEVDSYTPTVPEAVVQQYLLLGGVATDDPRMYATRGCPVATRA